MTSTVTSMEQTHPLSSSNRTIMPYNILIKAESSLQLLNRIIGPFTRRRIQIKELKLSGTALQGICVIDIKIDIDEKTLNKICLFLSKQVGVFTAHYKP